MPCVPLVDQPSQAVVKWGGASKVRRARCVETRRLAFTTASTLAKDARFEL